MKVTYLFLLILLSSLFPRSCVFASSNSQVQFLFQREKDLWAFWGQGKETLVVPRATSASWSPDGRRFAYVKAGYIYVGSFSKTNSARRIWALPRHTKEDKGENIQDVVLSWHPGLNLLAVSLFSPYQLRSAGERPGTTSNNLSAGNINLASIWLVYLDKKTREGETIAELWIEPLMRGKSALGISSAFSPSWAPDGDNLAFSRGGDLHLAELTNDDFYNSDRNPVWSELELSRISVDGGGGDSSEVMACGQISWKTDGKMIAFDVRRWNGRSYNWIKFYDRERRALLNTMLDGSQPCYIPRTSSLLFTGETDRNETDIIRYDQKTKGLKTLVRNGSNPECNPKVGGW